MPDIFQFYSASADAAPGKGTGETLESPAETYKELRAMKGWRKILSNSAVTPFTWKGKQWETVESALRSAASESAALMRELWEAKFSQNEDAKKVLLLTKNAQLWHAALRVPKVRWDTLEEIRSATQRNVEATPEMADAGAAPKPKKGGKKGKKVEAAVAEAAKAEEAKEAVEGVPEGAVVNGEGPLTAAANVELPPPDLEAPERQESAIRFCPVCRYYLYVEVNTGTTESLYRMCRNCGYRKADEKGGLLTEMVIQERATEGYKILLNEFTRRDPRLPHIKKDIKCPDTACDSNHGKSDPDVIYIKYDPVNMLYLYICDVCGHQWRSRR
jgi:DNA-directed RNA polymerase subunit M/transcription elongation factor TFIIS